MLDLNFPFNQHLPRLDGNWVLPWQLSRPKHQVAPFNMRRVLLCKQSFPWKTQHSHEKYVSWTLQFWNYLGYIQNSSLVFWGMLAKKSDVMIDTVQVGLKVFRQRGLFHGFFFLFGCLGALNAVLGLSTYCIYGCTFQVLVPWSTRVCTSTPHPHRGGKYRLEPSNAGHHTHTCINVMFTYMFGFGNVFLVLGWLSPPRKRRLGRRYPRHLKKICSLPHLNGGPLSGGAANMWLDWKNPSDCGERSFKKNGMVILRHSIFPDFPKWLTFSMNQIQYNWQYIACI